MNASQGKSAVLSTEVAYIEVAKNNIESNGHAKFANGSKDKVSNNCFSCFD